MVIDSIVALCMKSVQEVMHVMLYPKPETEAQRLAREERERKEKEEAEKAAADTKGKAAKRKASKAPESTYGQKQAHKKEGDDGDSEEEEDDDPEAEEPIFQVEVLFRDDFLVINPNKVCRGRE